MAKFEFTSKLDGWGPGGAWVFAEMPKTASAKLGSKARVPIAGTINGHAFRSSAMPTGQGSHRIQVNKSMQEGAKAAAGDRVRFVIEVDSAPRTVDVPPDVAREFRKASPEAREAFEKMPPSHRKRYIEWIDEAKRDDTRKRRVAQAIERITAGLDPFHRV